MSTKIDKLLIAGSDTECNDIAVYRYGLELIRKKICHTAVILMLALVCREFWSMLIFLVAYASIREYSGGYHAHSAARCFICTILVAATAIYLMKVPLRYMELPWLLGLMLVCGAGIWLLSPQEAENKPLGDTEKIVYRKMVYKYLIVDSIIALLGLWYPLLTRGIAAAWIIQIIMLLGGFLRKQSAVAGEKRI